MQTRSRLYSMISSLANEELVEEDHFIVCEIFIMRPIPTGLMISKGYDRRSRQFFDGLKVVDSPKGCWVSHSVEPKESYAKRTASAIESALITLRDELIANKYAE